MVSSVNLTMRRQKSFLEATLGPTWRCKEKWLKDGFKLFDFQMTYNSTDYSYALGSLAVRLSVYRSFVLGSLNISKLRRPR